MSNEWHPIPGFPGYEARAVGEVRSLRQGPPRVLNGSFDEDGYRVIFLRLDGKSVKRRLHQLIAATFHGPRPEGMDEIRHLDGDKSNNTAENLRYGTRSENQLDSVRHGTCRNAALTECPQSHPYDEANTYRSPTGRRECRICRRGRQRARTRQALLAA